MADETENARGGQSFMQWLSVLLVVTGLSAGAGTLASLHLISTSERISESQKPAPEKPIVAAYGASDALRKLSPVVTNLASPPNTWIRLEAAIVTDKLTEEESGLITARIGEDVVSYLRTLTPSQIEGARGLQYLREDLNERVVTRSSGKVRELIIETLVVQ